MDRSNFVLTLCKTTNFLSTNLENLATLMVNHLQHVILLGFKPIAKAEEIAAVETAFCGLFHKIDGIIDFKWGTNASPENLNQGYTHCFVLTFNSTEDRDAYLIHPDHQAFVDLLRLYLKQVCVVDFWEQPNL